MKNKGITLIALIVTIIVMIIISGVAVRTVFSENSAITSAQKAKYQNSITQIEQGLNEFYVQNYIEIDAKNLGDFKEDTPITKARALAYYLEDTLGADNIFKTALPNGMNYTYHKFDNDKYAYVSSEGLIFYMLSPEKLKKFDPLLTVFDLEEPDSRKGTDDIDNIYGVTADLRVFIIEKDLDHLIGITKEELSTYDLNSVIYKYGSDWAKILGEESDVTYQTGQTKKNLKLNFKSTPVDTNFDLSGIGELKNLTNLNLINCNVKNIKGIKESAESLKYLYIEKSTIESFEGLESLTNLEELFLCDITQSQFNLIIGQIAKGNLSHLKKIGLGVSGVWGNDAYNNVTYEYYYTNRNSTITNIDELAKLKQGTKDSLEYIFLIGYEIESLAPLSNFNNLVGIRADGNNIKNLKGLGNKKNLTTIKVCNNKLTSLEGLSGNTKLTFLDVRKNPDLENISDANRINTPKLTELWFRSTSLTRNDSDTNILESEVIDNSEFLISLGGGLLIDSKYSKLLVDYSTTTSLSLTGNIESSVFDSYSKCTKLDRLSINGITIVNNGKAISAEETNSKINTLLSNSNLNSIKYLQIINMGDKVSSADFFSKMTNLLEVDFRQNSATNIEGLINSPLKHLSIDNKDIKLSTDKMQQIINKLTNEKTQVWTYGSGLNLCNSELYKQLGSCTKLKKLILDRDWQFQVGGVGVNKEKDESKNTSIFVDLSKCETLTEVYIYNIYATFKLPSSVKNVKYGYVYSNKNVVTYDTNSNASYTNTESCINDIILDLSQATDLESLNFTQLVEPTILEKTLNSIPEGASKFNYLRFYCQTRGPSSFSKLLNKFSNYPNLKTIVYSAQNQSPLIDLEGINRIKSLETIDITLADKLNTLSDMSELKNLKSLTITNPVKNYSDTSGLVEIPDVGLRKLNKLEKLNFSNNSIASIYGLIPQEDGDFSALKELNLENNSLEDQFTIGARTCNIENSIFVPLYNKKLRKLFLAGNKFNGLSQITKLSWKDEDKSGF